MLLRSAMVVSLVCLATPAAAQPACWPDTSLPVKFQVARAPVGTIKPGEVVYAASPLGLVFGWACIAPDGTWRHMIAGGPWTAFTPDWLATADTLLRGTAADRNAAWVKYATGPIDARLKPDVDAIMAMLPKPPPLVPPPPLPPPPPPPVISAFVVAPTTICPTVDKDAGGKCFRRPTYAWDGKVRAIAAAAEKADIGSACDATVGATGFHGVLGRTDRVALCVKR